MFQDQYDNLSLHTQKGIDFLEKYGHFIRDRCAIEMEYAGKLRWVYVLIFFFFFSKWKIESSTSSLISMSIVSYMMKPKRF